MTEKNKELAKWFKDNCKDRGHLAYMAIMKLIQQSRPIPTTTEEKIFSFLNNLLTIQIDAEDEDSCRQEIEYIKNWLKKIGVEVKDEK